MRPMPKRLLIHRVSVLTPDGEPDAWGEQTETETMLSFVRTDPTSKFVIDKTQKQVQLQAVLYYDLRHSRPRSFPFVEGQKIRWDGREYRIATVEPLYDGKKLHHLEVGLG